MPKWKAILTNNTDYPHGAEFTSCAQLRRHNRHYYRGAEGNAYWEQWNVEYTCEFRELPDCLLDLLEPSEYQYDDRWQRVRR